jgi:hypothetical protein
MQKNLWDREWGVGKYEPLLACLLLSIRREATSSSNQVAQELTPVQEASLSADRIVCLINMSRYLTSLSQSSSSEHLQEYLANKAI